MCSLATGFCHKVIPHVKVVIDQLASTGAFEVVHTDDVNLFDADSLKKFDAVILNNTCSKRPIIYEVDSGKCLVMIFSSALTSSLASS